MDKVAIAVMPIADLGAWQELSDEISTGERGEAHRAFLRRGGVTAEHVFHQQTPMGDLAVLVWEGVEPEQLGKHFASVLQNPTTDHEKYLRDYVVPKLHGIDMTQPPPPPAQRVATITT
jgi:hypothetical protein